MRIAVGRQNFGDQKEETTQNSSLTVRFVIVACTDLEKKQQIIGLTLITLKEGKPKVWCFMKNSGQKISNVQTVGKLLNLCHECTLTLHRRRDQGAGQRHELRLDEISENHHHHSSQ